MSGDVPPVALLHYACPPVVGGVEEIVRQQASVLARHGHRVLVIAGAGEKFEPDIPVAVDGLFGSRHGAAERAAGDPRLLEDLSHLVLERLEALLDGFSVLLAHNVLAMPYNLPLTLALIELARRGRTAVVAWQHDSPYFYPAYPEHLDREPWTVLRRAHPGIRYVTISHARGRQFEELYGARTAIEVVPDGIDPIRFFRLDPATARLVAEQRLFEAELLLVQPSRLHPRKNIELSIRIIRALADLGCRARLLLTGAYDPHEPGSAGYARRLAALAEELGVRPDILLMADYIFADGTRLAASRITIRDLYLIADVLFLPSLQEGFGVPLLEAGMIKMPIACSDIPPFAEIAGQDCLRFALDEPPASIARRLLDYLAAMPTHRHFRRVMSRYVWDSLYERSLRGLIERAAATVRAAGA